MTQNCEMLKNCRFFKNYHGNSEVIREGWVSLFCESQEKSEKCKRKLIRKETGKPPPDNLSPTGKLLMVVQ